MKKLFVFLILFAASEILVSQSNMKNASFEGDPGKSIVPKGWVTCIPGSTPDILPGKWNVSKAPQDGFSYLGLITRENGTFESVGQRLETPLESNSCYTFSVYLARSDTYTGYNLPLRLKIWGSKKYCDKEQLLVSTKAIKHTNWEKYEFQIYTKSKVHFLVFEACKAPGITEAYRGNILIDNISQIKPCFKAEILDRNLIPQKASVSNFSAIQILASTLQCLSHFVGFLLLILVQSIVFRCLVIGY